APRSPPGIRRGVADQGPDRRGRRLGSPFGFDMQRVHQLYLLLCTMWYMYHMVHSGMTTSQARERLLAAAVEQAMRGGIADLSLRELAAAIGTSHRMLLYHFGSREGLLTAVARAVEESQRAVVSEWGITRANARRLWQHFSDPQLWPAERLFFELYAQALLGRPGTEGFLDNAIEPWISALV